MKMLIFMKWKWKGSLLKFIILFLAFLFLILILFYTEKTSSHALFAQETIFFVKKIKVKGNTVLTKSEIAKVVSPFEGQELELATLKQVAEALAKLYHKKGYILAQAYILPQEIKEGVVEIQVMEGRIGNVKIEGNKVYRTSLIRYFLLPATKKRVWHNGRFQKALLLLNEFPDLEVKSFLQPGKEAGTTDVLIKAVDKTPIHVEFDYNNFGSRFIGVNRGGIDISHGNLMDLGDYIEFKAIFSFPSRQEPFISGTHMIPISPHGTKLVTSYASADMKVGQELQVLDIRGVANIYGVGVIHPVARTVEHSSNLSMVFYLKDIQNFVFGEILTSQDKLREVVLGYNASWVTGRSRKIIDVSLTQGLGTLFGGMPNEDPLASRQGAGNSFTKINVNLAYITKVSTTNFLILRGLAQYGFNLLAPTEQFAIGGPDSVRGFPQSAFLGDSGWNAIIELRIPFSGQASKNIVQGTFFVDTATALFRNPFPGQNGKESLTGGGVGIRTTFGEATSLRVDLGFPLAPPINSVSLAPIVYIQFSKSF